MVHATQGENTPSPKRVERVADGNHDLLGDKAFGASVYGYGQYTSYWYPGGLDLEPLPQ